VLENPSIEIQYPHYHTCTCDDCMMEDAKQVEASLYEDDIEVAQDFGDELEEGLISQQELDSHHEWMESKGHSFGGDTGIDADFNPFGNMDDPDNYPDPDGVMPLGG